MTFSNIQTKLVAECIDASHLDRVFEILSYSPVQRIDRNLKEFIEGLPPIVGVNLMDVYWDELICYYAVRLAQKRGLNK